MEFGDIWVSTMSFLTKHLKERTTFWSATGLDASGDPSFAAPKAIQTNLADWREAGTGYSH